VAKNDGLTCDFDVGNFSHRDAEILEGKTKNMQGSFRNLRRNKKPGGEVANLTTGLSIIP
jgi:hypothetical protein